MNGGFINLKFCGSHADNELIWVYSKYKEEENENENENEVDDETVSVKMLKNDLRNVVTDFDVVFKSKFVAAAYLENIEQRINKHLNKEATSKVHSINAKKILLYKDLLELIIIKCFVFYSFKQRKIF